MSTSSSLAIRYVVFAGPEQAGAAETLATLSDDPVADRNHTVECGVDTEQRAVLLTNGRLGLDDDGELELIMAAADQPVDLLVELAVDQGAGLIIVLDNKRPYPLRDMHFFLHSFARLIEQSSVAIGVTNRDRRDDYQIADYHRELADQGMHVPVFTIDPCNREHAVKLVEALLLSADARQSLSDD